MKKIAALAAALLFLLTAIVVPATAYKSYHAIVVESGKIQDGQLIEAAQGILDGYHYFLRRLPEEFSPKRLEECPDDTMRASADTMSVLRTAIIPSYQGMHMVVKILLLVLYFFKTLIWLSII